MWLKCQKNDFEFHTRSHVLIPWRNGTATARAVHYNGVHLVQKLYGGASTVALRIEMHN